MDLDSLIENCQLFFQNNKAIALAILAALCVFGYLKPKEFFKLLLLALFLGVILYIVSLLGESTTTGIQQKDEMMHKTEDLLK